MHPQKALRSLIRMDDGTTVIGFDHTLELKLDPNQMKLTPIETDQLNKGPRDRKIESMLQEAWPVAFQRAGIEKREDLPDTVLFAINHFDMLGETLERRRDSDPDRVHLDESLFFDPTGHPTPERVISALIEEIHQLQDVQAVRSGPQKEPASLEEIMHKTITRIWAAYATREAALQALSDLDVGLAAFGITGYAAHLAGIEVLKEKDHDDQVRFLLEYPDMIKERVGRVIQAIKE